jgi:hypothetical protein
MLLSEDLSPIFSNKTKSSGNAGVNRFGGANNSYDIVEHDVTNLTRMSNLPKPDSFEALQISSDR